MRVAHKSRKLVALVAMALAVTLVPALGASAKNSGSGSSVSAAERHEYKDSLSGPFSYYRENNLRHNVGHHNRHYQPRAFRPI